MPAERSARRLTAPGWIDASLGLGRWNPGPRFAWHGRIAVAVAFVALLALGSGTWLFMSGPPRVDFISFWAAGHLAMGGHPSLAYDYAAHRAAEMTVTPMGEANPFPYPPPFLLALLPFGFHPVWLAYLLWNCITGGLFLMVTRKLLPASYALAQPAAIFNLMNGQTAFLTCSLFIAGMTWIDTAPILAGLIIGLLIYKPQLAVLIPLALLAGRHWRTIGAACASSLGLLAVSLLLFGFDSYAGFFALARQYSGFMAAGAWRWSQVASLFGMARWWDAPQSISLVLQIFAAAIAAVLTWRAWAARLDQRVPILAAATLLVSPYIFTYDTLLLVVPMAWQLRSAQAPWKVAMLWALCFLPVMSAMNLIHLANLAPMIAMLSLWWLHGSPGLRWLRRPFRRLRTSSV